MHCENAKAKTLFDFGGWKVPKHHENWWIIEKFGSKRKSKFKEQSLLEGKKIK